VLAEMEAKGGVKMTGAMYNLALVYAKVDPKEAMAQWERYIALQTAACLQDAPFARFQPDRNEDLDVWFAGEWTRTGDKFRRDEDGNQSPFAVPGADQGWLAVVLL